MIYELVERKRGTNGEIKDREGNSIERAGDFNEWKVGIRIEANSRKRSRTYE